MTQQVTVEKRVHFVRGTKGRKQMRAGDTPIAPQRVPRIARLMALAIHFDELIRTGKVKDQSELARLGQVSTARVSQIMGLLYLAPEIQEDLLAVENGIESKKFTERSLRPVSNHSCWTSQRELWKSLGVRSATSNKPIETDV